MSGFENNLPINSFPATKNASKGKEALNKANLSQNQNPTEQIANNIQPNQTKVGQSLANTNSNIVINQPTQTSPGVTQAALNATNTAQSNPNQQNIKNDTNTQVQSTPSQVEFQGSTDLPAYAGIANMSLKSYIAGQENKSFTNLESSEKQLTTTLDGIKGFQRQNYEGEDNGSLKKKNSKDLKQIERRRNLLILSHIFSSIEEPASRETELLVNISTFRKLGSSLKDGRSNKNEKFIDLKLSPPLPNEPQKLESLNATQIKSLQQLLALPSEFPEFLRLFAKENIEINMRELNLFLMQRLKLVRDQIIGGDTVLSKQIAKFIPLLNQQHYSALLPLVLLYYPLPLPIIKEEYDFLNDWKRKKNKKGNKSPQAIASCEIYYLSRTRGRFLLKFELNEKCEFSFDAQTNKTNNGIVKDIEEAIAECMILLEIPPSLSDLNVLLTQEIYKATDIDEELSIVSSGPLRLEIVLAVYAALIVLNKLNDELDPSGLIDIIE